jgi:hypothetical protein
LTPLLLAPALGIAAGILVAGIATFFFWRRRAKSSETVPIPDLPAEGEALDEPAIAPLEPDYSSFAPEADYAPELEAGPEYELEPQPEQAIERWPEQAPVVTPEMNDPATPTKLSFRLLLPTQGQARSAAQIARRDGYVADVQPPVDPSTEWTCLLTREMLPSAAAIDEELTFLGELAAGFGGRVER